MMEMMHWLMLHLVLSGIRFYEAGLTFRDYGEFVKAEIEPKDATWTELYNQFKAGTDDIKIRATTELHTSGAIPLSYLCGISW